MKTEDALSGEKNATGATSPDEQDASNDTNGVANESDDMVSCYTQK